MLTNNVLRLALESVGDLGDRGRLCLGAVRVALVLVDLAEDLGDEREDYRIDPPAADGGDTA